MVLAILALGALAVVCLVDDLPGLAVGFGLVFVFLARRTSWRVARWSAKRALRGVEETATELRFGKTRALLTVPTGEAVAETIEKTRTHLAGLLGAGHDRTHVFVFDRSEHYQRFMRRLLWSKRYKSLEVAGVHLPFVVSHIACQRELLEVLHQWLEPTLAHELTHAFVYNAGRLGDPPPWFGEGLAEAVSIAVAEPARVSAQLRLLRRLKRYRRDLSWSQISGWGQEDLLGLSRRGRDPDVWCLRRAFYVQSWALMQHICDRGEEGRRFVRSVARTPLLSRGMLRRPCGVRGEDLMTAVFSAAEHAPRGVSITERARVKALVARARGTDHWGHRVGVLRELAYLGGAEAEAFVEEARQDRDLEDWALLVQRLMRASD